MEREGAALVNAVATDPAAPVAAYAGWVLADLARHVGQVQHWVAGVVSEQAQERPAMAAAEVEDEVVAGWLAEATQRVVDALRGADPGVEVWTISRHERTTAFWAHRMALEATLHRWDAEDALGRAPAVDLEVALAGVEEALRLYLEQRLPGRDVGGHGQRVGFEPVLSPGDVGGAPEGWTLQLDVEGVSVDDGLARTDAVVRGGALDLWLLLSRRRELDGFEVVGDADAAELAVRAANLVAGPAG